jgi:serpin B
MLFKKITGLAFIGMIAGCSTNPVSDNNKNTGDLKFAVSKSLSVTREVVVPNDPKINEEATRINRFAIKMYAQLIKEGGNTFFSPYSITTALGMADVGAKGTTDQQIRQALEVTLPGSDFHYALNGLNQSLENHSSSTDNLELNVANSIWAQNSDFYVLFLNDLSQHYSAGVNLLDFKNDPDPSRLIINNWVSEQTNQRIKDLIPERVITTDTRLVLTNAIYFLADWEIKFDISKTDDKPFWRLDVSSVSVPTMMLRDSTLKLLYYKSESARVLELPYKGKRIVMDFILPDSGTFNNFEATLTSDKIITLLNGLDSVALPPVRIPRFQFATPSISLKKAFVELGMTVPFTPGADFSGINDKDLMILDIVHKAFIKVEEKGTEAAAATAVIMVPTSMSPENMPSFVANRPFIYLIRDTQTNAILFMGRVLDPTVSE